MNCYQLIESGILENYVLGYATASEIKKIQEMEKIFPEVNNEINEIEESLILYAESFSIKLLEEFKYKVIASTFK